ncbi:hypothetical protein C8R44DRAFT_846113 [Mycena epipterygia]|nr:hypothetical protein C8R44DRAFT_846113 [Mycena epipterygia]
MSLFDILAGLFSATTLRHARIILGNFTQPSKFMQIFHNSSASINHFEIHCVEELGEIPHQCTAPKTRLESLRPLVWPPSYGVEGIYGFWDAFEGGKHPRKVSECSQPPIRMCFGDHAFKPLKPSTVYLTHAPHDLSALHNLAILRLYIDPPNYRLALKTLSTITASSRIRQIIIRSPVRNNHICDQLDARLGSFPMQDSPVVVLEMPAAQFSDVYPYFHRLSAKGVLRRGDCDDDWFNAKAFLIDSHVTANWA